MRTVLAILAFLWGFWVFHQVMAARERRRSRLSALWLGASASSRRSWYEFRRSHGLAALSRRLGAARLPVKSPFLDVYRARLALEFRRAGWPEAAHWDWVALQSLVIVAGFMWSVWVGGAEGVVIAVAGAALPWAAVKSRSGKRGRELLRSLPEAFDLIAAAMAAGLDLGGAIRIYAAKASPGPLRDELRHLDGDLGAGRPREEAFRSLMERAPFDFLEEAWGVVLQGLELGGSVGPVLKGQAGRLRALWWQDIEKRAQEAPVRLLFPLIAFIFPTIFIVLLGPFLLSLKY